MMQRSPTSEDLTLGVVGSSIFGQYPKISSEQTWNLYISDNWMVSYPGYNLLQTLNSGNGRNIYSSRNVGAMFAVVSNIVYKIESNLNHIIIGNLNTFVGDVFIAEDNQFNPNTTPPNGGHVLICDKENIWVYNTVNGSFQLALSRDTMGATHPLDFVPGYIIFQEGIFISVDLQSATWRISDAVPDPVTGTIVFPSTSQFVGGFETKTGFPLAAVPVPGKGNMILILGSTGGQFWTNTAYQLFPYTLNQGISVDYGILNADTLAYDETIAVWLGGNENSGAVIMYTTGGKPEKISTDGIDFKLNALDHPEDSHAIIFRINGHLIYHITFVKDNVSLFYDFNTQKFYNTCDSKMNYHIAKNIALFNNTYYFVAIADGNLYQMDDQFTTFNGDLIPRIRITPTFRKKNTKPFRAQNVTFPIEQGVDVPNFTENNVVNLSRVDLSISNDGGYNFGNSYGLDLNRLGTRKSIFIYYDLGWSNELTCQFRFWSEGRIVYGEGTVSLYQ